MPLSMILKVKIYYYQYYLSYLEIMTKFLEHRQQTVFVLYVTGSSPKLQVTFFSDIYLFLNELALFLCYSNNSPPHMLLNHGYGWNKGKNIVFFKNDTPCLIRHYAILSCLDISKLFTNICFKR